MIGGRLADTRGRRPVGAFGVAVGTLLTVAMVLAGGWRDVGAVGGGRHHRGDGRARHQRLRPGAVPHLAAGRANGTIAILGVTGSVIGLLTAGWLSERWDGLGPALAALSIGPLIMAVLVLVAYPETAHRELEDINPEDRARPARGDPERSRGTDRLTAVSGPPTVVRRTLAAAVAGALALTGCGAERPELADRAETTTTTTESTTTTVPEPPDPEVATAKATTIDVYDAEDAADPSRQIVSGVDTSVDTIPIVFLVKARDEDDERLEVYLPVRPNGSTGWVNADDVTVTSVPLPHRGGHLRAPT